MHYRSLNGAYGGVTSFRIKHHWRKLMFQAQGVPHKAYCMVMCVLLLLQKLGWCKNPQDQSIAVPRKWLCDLEDYIWGVWALVKNGKIAQPR
jgi:hypothetical protein